MIKISKEVEKKADRLGFYIGVICDKVIFVKEENANRFCLSCNKGLECANDGYICISLAMGLEPKSITLEQFEKMKG